MIISLNGPPIKDFDPTKSIDPWYFGGKSNTHIMQFRKDDWELTDGYLG
jgi:hypothetical protein